MREPTEREIEIAVDVACRNRQWDRLLRMLLDVPLPACLGIIDRLKDSGWRPESEYDAAFLDEVLRVRQEVGEVPAKPKPPEVALGPVVGEWIERGRSGESTTHGPDELRRTLQDAAPPDAVAALAALATSGRSTTDDAETALNHRHWLVRLAAFALCEVYPSLVLAGVPSGTGGGDVWIEQFAPSLHESAPLSWRAGRIGIEGLDALQSAINRPERAGAGLLGWARLLEVLARRRHTETIE